MTASPTPPTPAQPALPPVSGATSARHDKQGAMGHIVPLSLLVKIFVTLVLLTILTLLASDVDFGEFNLVVALAIAIIKASLVVLFFMHLRWDKPFNSIVFIGCLIFVGLFISLSLLDSHQYRKSETGGQAPGVKDVHHLLTPPPVPQPEMP